jgi:tRNA (guanine-N7-)-methyltransferase
MRRRNTLRDHEAAIEFVPASITLPLDFAQIFVRAAPLTIDLGCGDGAFLAGLATANPQRNYLGVERLPGRVRSVCRKVAKLALPNVRVLRMDTAYAVEHLIAADGVSQFHLLFPDPWPKRRHHRRRTMTNGFVAAIHRALVPDGLFHIATDYVEYFQHIERITHSLFAPASVPISFPQSTFEKRFADRDLTIHRLLLRKISPVK